MQPFWTFTGGRATDQSTPVTDPVITINNKTMKNQALTLYQGLLLKTLILPTIVTHT